MLKVKTSKRSPQKKTETLEDLVLTIEFQVKKLCQKITQYREQLAVLAPSVNNIEKAIKKEVAFKVPDLYREFNDANDCIAKLNKDIEKQQKLFHKIQTEFAKKLTTPLAMGQFSSLKAEMLVKIKTGVKTIQDLIDANSKPIHEIVDGLQNFTKRLAAVEQDVHRICLPEQLSEIEKLNQKFLSQIEVLCKDTVGIRLNADPASPDAQIKSTFLLMFASHQKGKQLLEQVQRNIDPTAVAMAMAAPAATIAAPTPTTASATAVPNTPVLGSSGAATNTAAFTPVVTISGISMAPGASALAAMAAAEHSIHAISVKK